MKLRWRRSSKCLKTVEAEAVGDHVIKPLRAGLSIPLDTAPRFVALGGNVSAHTLLRRLSGGLLFLA